MIALAETSEAIAATAPIMLQLRPHLAPDAYVATVQRMMQTDGYRLVAAYEDGVPRAVAGYRFMEMLYCGHILSVDDLNTDETQRSRGHGRRLLEWLIAEAKSRGCDELHLDSAVHRARAHRFYFREGMSISAFHFRLPLR